MLTAGRALSDRDRRVADSPRWGCQVGKRGLQSTGVYPRTYIRVGWEPAVQL